MKIKSANSAIKHIVPFSDAERDHFEFLKSDPYFEVSVLNYRKRLGIPENGFELSALESIKQIEGLKVKDLIDVGLLLCRFYKLPSYWKTTFILYLLFDKTITIKDELTYSPVDILRRDNKVILEINEKISIKELNRIIKLKSSEYKKAVNALPERPKRKIKSLGLRKELVQLRGFGTKSSGEITDTLVNKYGDEKKTIDIDNEPTVRVYISKNNRKLNRQIGQKNFDHLSFVLGILDIADLSKK